MQTSHALRPARRGDTMRAASRQVWLAGLGAAVVTRDWANREAGNVFRALVHEGSAVEARTLRVVGERLDPSLTRASAVLRQARAALEHAAKRYTGSAITLVRATLPRRLPTLAVVPSNADAAPTARRKRATKARRATGVKSAKRGARRAAKRAAKR